MATWTLIFSFLFLLGSCQVKETAGGSGLISGHAPATNAFTLNAPTAGTRVTGNTLTITLSFPYEVAVDTAGGIPYLALTIGASSRNASYVSGNGTKILSFSYAIVSADNDSDGVTVNSLNLNGGTMTFTVNGTTSNCSTTLTATTFSNVLVDNTAPTITGFTPSNLPGFYNLGDTLSFRMTYSEPVIVTGTPRFMVTFTTGGSVYATYAGGTGTTSLSFTYTIVNTVADSDGYAFTSPLDLNGGAIQDAVGNVASLDFSAHTATAQTDSALRDFDGRLPFVTLVTPPANGSYVAAQDLDVTVAFDRAVTVTGTPYIVLTIGANSRLAYYVSGSGTNSLLFRYTTVPGDEDADGITIANTIIQNAGNITGSSTPTNSYFTNVLNNIFSVPSTTGVICAAIQPQPISVSRNVDGSSPVWGASPDNVWIIGQQMLITVGFNTGIYVNQTLGSPRIPMTIGSSSVYATYLSGGDGQTSIVFSYTIQEGDLDNDGSIAIGNIELNGGTMTDAANTNALLTLPSSSLSSTTVDGVRPTISSVTAPPNGAYSEAALSSFDFTVTWSEAVNYSSTASTAAYISLNIGGTNVNAVWESGSNTTSFVHTPASLTGLNDADGITVNSPFAGSGTFRDQAGNSANVLTFTPPTTTSVLVDTTLPTVTGVTSPAAGRYYTGNDLDFTLTFSESVTVGTAGGPPYIQIRIGANIRNATVTAAGSGTTHTFRYRVVATDTDPDYVAYESSNITIPTSSYIIDPAINHLSPATFSDPTWTGVVVDEIVPTISTASTVAGRYVDTADGTSKFTITANVSEAVTVDTLGGTPYLSIAMATGNVNAVYNSATSTSTSLSFDYTVNGTVDMDLDGLSLAIASIQANGGTIEDAAGNAANLAMPAVTNIGSVIVAPHATVWIKGSTTNLSGFTTKPTITTDATLTAGYYQFDGLTTSLSFSSLGTVEALYMAIGTPALADTYPQDLISAAAATLNNSNINMGTTDNPTIRSSTSGYSGSGNNHANIFPVSTNQELEFIFSPAGATLPTAPFISTQYSGKVAEIIIFDTALTTNQKNHVFSYLDGAY